VSVRWHGRKNAPCLSFEVVWILLSEETLDVEGGAYIDIGYRVEVS
jgi:hypothetical protein